VKIRKWNTFRVYGARTCFRTRSQPAKPAAKPAYSSNTGPASTICRNVGRTDRVSTAPAFSPAFQVLRYRRRRHLRRSLFLLNLRLLRPAPAQLFRNRRTEPPDDLLFPALEKMTVKIPGASFGQPVDPGRVVPVHRIPGQAGRLRRLPVPAGRPGKPRAAVGDVQHLSGSPHVQVGSEFVFRRRRAGGDIRRQDPGRAAAHRRRELRRRQGGQAGTKRLEEPLRPGSLPGGRSQESVDQQRPGQLPGGDGRPQAGFRVPAVVRQRQVHEADPVLLQDLSLLFDPGEISLVIRIHQRDHTRPIAGQDEAEIFFVGRIGSQHHVLRQFHHLPPLQGADLQQVPARQVGFHLDPPHRLFQHPSNGVDPVLPQEAVHVIPAGAVPGQFQDSVQGFLVPGNPGKHRRLDQF